MATLELVENAKVMIFHADTPSDPRDGERMIVSFNDEIKPLSETEKRNWASQKRNITLDAD